MDVAEDMQPWLDTPLHGVKELHAAHPLHLLGDPVQKTCAGDNRRAMTDPGRPSPWPPGSSSGNLGDTGGPGPTGLGISLPHAPSRLSRPCPPPSALWHGHLALPIPAGAWQPRLPPLQGHTDSYACKSLEWTRHAGGGVVLDNCSKWPQRWHPPIAEISTLTPAWAR